MEDRQVECNEDKNAAKTDLFSHDGQNEIGVWFREEQVLTYAGTQTNAYHSAVAETDNRLLKLIIGAGEIEYPPDEVVVDIQKKSDKISDDIQSVKEN